MTLTLRRDVQPMVDDLASVLRKSVYATNVGYKSSAASPNLEETVIQVSKSMANKTTSPFPYRLKHDGSEDSMCLACFKTLSPGDLEPATVRRAVEEQDHICAFAFPDRRSNDVTYEDGPKRRRSDMQWQTLISREAIIPAE